MGCFDSTCCITGLPIHHYDKIKAALLIPYPYRTPCYVGGDFQFWTLPVTSEYNDYGNIEWKKLKPNEKFVLEFILKLTLPFAGNHKAAYSQLWENLLRGDLEVKLPYRETTNLFPWMCHEWAWKAIIKMHPMRANIPDDAKKFTDREFQSSCLATEAGGFSQFLEDLIKDSVESCTNLYEMLVEAAHFTCNCYFVRKPLTPLYCFGEQYESLDKLVGFTALIAEKAKEKVRKDD